MVFSSEQEYPQLKGAAINCTSWCSRLHVPIHNLFANAQIAPNDAQYRATASFQKHHQSSLNILPFQMKDLEMAKKARIVRCFLQWLKLLAAYKAPQQLASMMIRSMN